MAELGTLQPLFHMSQHILVGDKVNEAGTRIGGQTAELLSSERSLVAEKIAVLGVVEAETLHIELQMVNAHPTKEVNQGVKRLHLGNLVAANIQHNAAHLQRRGVLHGAYGQEMAGRLDNQLAQRLNGIIQACAVRTVDVHGAGRLNFYCKRAGDTVCQLRRYGQGAIRSCQKFRQIALGIIPGGTAGVLQCRSH